jgi:hypothetical protein
VNLGDLQNRLGAFSLFKGLDQLAKGHIRIETQLKYPDGTSIEVFLKSPIGQQNFTLSDLGQTTAWLMTAQVRPWLSKKRQALLSEVVRTSGARQEGGALEISAPTVADITVAAVRLAQCCSRVADLTFTKRTSLQTLAKEEIEEFLVDIDATFESDVALPCRGREVKVDFLVTTPVKASAILALSSKNNNSAHTMANEIFTKWYDIEKSGHAANRVTIYDDRNNVYRAEDLDRLQEVSVLLPFSDKSGLQTVIAA